MSTITIKNIPEDLYERLKLRAKVNHRSVNSEVIAIVERAVGVRNPLEVEDILERARETRELSARYRATAEEIDRWKREGRE